MKRIGVILVLSALLCFALLGCDEDDLAPYFTRFDTSGDCGVAPFDVEFYAIATGGNEKVDPTGANLYLDIDWNFGDEQTTSSSSIVYHTYDSPGTYTVTVTVTDDDGDQATESVMIEVLPDTLEVWAEADPAVTVAVGEQVSLESFASSCEIDPDPEAGDYSRLAFRWAIDDTAGGNEATIYHRRNPIHTFTDDDVGLRQIIASIQFAALSVVRKDTIFIEVTPAP